MGRRSWHVRDIVEVYLHWQAGDAIQAIAPSLGLDRKTVRKYIRAAEAAGLDHNHPRSGVRQRFPELVDARVRSDCFRELDAHQEFIRDGLRTNCATTVWHRLCRQTGLGVSLSSFRRYLRLIMPEMLDPRKVTVWRPEVAPGEEAQVDFGSLGLWEDPRTGKRQRIWAFALALSYSRHLFIRPVMRLDSLTWLTCHVAAFGFLEAVPQRIVLDNLKDGVLKPDLYDPQYNRAYAELCRLRNYAGQSFPRTRSLDVVGLVARVIPRGAA